MANRNVRIALLAILISVLVLTALFSAYRFGRFAQSDGDYKVARWWYRVAAVVGNASAQTNLAGLYAEGLGGKKDNAKQNQ